jgi:hypothetical protein
MKTFTVELTNDDLSNPEKMQAFQSMMDDINHETNSYIMKLATDLNVSDSCAADVFYLRGRSRWTQELETELIRLHKEGKPPNICEYGHSLMKNTFLKLSIVAVFQP